jgi:hypothetical protein
MSAPSSSPSLEQEIAGSDKLAAPERTKLHARLSTKRGLARFLRSTAQGLLRINRRAVSAEAHVDGKYLEPSPAPPAPANNAPS